MSKVTKPHHDFYVWDTKDEITFLRKLAKKDISKLKRYFLAIRLRSDWGKIDKNKITMFCAKFV